MFLLYTMTDIIVVKPESMQEDPYVSLLKQIQNKYLFKILESEGMCVEIISFKNIECIIVNGMGDLQYHIELQMIIFRPVKDEVLVGRASRSTPEGLYVSLEFVEVFIPGGLLNQPSKYDRNDNVWTWIYNDIGLVYEKGEKIRFKVQKAFIDLKDKNLEKPEFIIGATNEDALGLLSWWMPS